MQINLTWNCRVCVEMVFLCLLCSFLPSLTTLEWIDQKFEKTKMGYISLPSNLNGIIGITSYYCVILKIMILHNATKTIKNKVFPFSLEKEQNLVSFQKKPGRFFFSCFLNPEWIIHVGGNGIWYITTLVVLMPLTSTGYLMPSSETFLYAFVFI